jgi:NADP-dependent 3-hydroxy acid dehydrogenase YdfG
MKLADQVAIVTRCSSGIGEGIARALAERGLLLMRNGRRAERLEQLSAKLGRSVAGAGAIGDPTTPQRLIDWALERFGRRDGAIDSAPGRPHPDRPARSGAAGVLPRRR